MPPPILQFQVEDLEPDHRVIVRCWCGHRAFLTKEELLSHPRIQPFDRVIGLGFHLRCAVCRKRGHVEITVTRFTPY
jgi:hypothetical protein